MTLCPSVRVVVLVIATIGWFALGATPMAGDPAAEYAEIAEKVSEELAIRFTDPDDPGLYERRQRLKALFAKVPPEFAETFYDRLGKEPTSDELSQRFHHTLHSATRAELLGILRDNIPAPLPEEAEGDSAVAFSYHGMLIKDGEVLEDVPSETLDAYFGVPPSEAEPEAEPEDTEAEPEEEVETRQAFTPPLLTTSYAVQCAMEAVPIPPSFASGYWTNLGRLPADRIFAGKKRVEVLAYEPVDSNGQPLGLCVALPRGPEDGSIQQLGVICQSKSTGKACFWDNKDRFSSSGASLTAASYQDLDINRFQDGSQLRENCTLCHRGVNAYVIHEDTILASKLSREVRNPAVTPYTPIGRKSADPACDWVNPQHANQPSNCSGCHKFPAFSFLQYCETVLLPSIGTTMPPAGKDKSKYAKGIKEIEDECKALKRAAECPATP